MVTSQDFVRRHKSWSHLTLQNSNKHSGSEFRVKQQWQNSYRNVTSPLHMKRQVLKFILGMYTPMFFYLTILVAFYMYYFANMVSTILKRSWILILVVQNLVQVLEKSSISLLGLEKSLKFTILSPPDTFCVKLDYFAEENQAHPQCKNL